jgi:hypothetical protein
MLIVYNLFNVFLINQSFIIIFVLLLVLCNDLYLFIFYLNLFNSLNVSLLVEGNLQLCIILSLYYLLLMNNIDQFERDEYSL